MKLAEDVLQAGEGFVPGAYLVDAIPIRELFLTAYHSFLSFFTVKYVPDWFPGAGFKRKAKLWNKYLTDGTMIPYEEVAKSFVCTRLVTAANPV